MKVLATLVGIATTLGVVSAAPAISKAFDITTWSGHTCNGTNEGETIVQAGQTECVNYSNANSYGIHKTGMLNECNKVKVVKFHNTGCVGAVYQIVYIQTNGNPTCVPLDQTTNPGSALFSCPG